MDPAQTELEELLHPKEVVETQTQAPVPQVEEIEYYLGDKANKIPVNAELQFTEGGKPLRTPLGTILNHYRQRSDLDRKSVEFKKEREQWEKERGDIEQYKANQQKYGAIQSWSEQNPKDFEYLYNLYQNRTQHLLGRQNEDGQQVPPQVAEKIAALEKQLEEVQEFKASLTQKEEEALDEKAAQEVTEEMKTFRKDFPEVNLDEVGQEGRTLEKEILLHGVRNQIPTFKLAAFDFLGPKVTEILIGRGRSEAVKSFRKDKESGVVSRSRVPQSGQGVEANISKTSWADLHQAAKAELEQALGST